MIPITSREQLPVVGQSTEQPSFDAKADLGTYRKKDIWDALEMAKDIAAMANGQGGTILIGVATNGNVVSKIIGISDVDARDAAQKLERAARDRCRPSPLLSTELVPLESAVVLAVNVWPSPQAPVGVQLGASSVPKGDYAWIFPIRVGSETAWLQPDQFATLENVTVRRMAALLAGIPIEERSSLAVRARAYSSTSDIVVTWNASLVALDLRANVLSMQATSERGGASQPMVVPIDWVSAVWREPSGVWKIALTCVIRDLNRVFEPQPP